MPTYQYACTACGHQLEAVQSFADEPLTECPACEGKLRKVFNSVGIVFKGSGFYRTDSRANGSSGATSTVESKPAESKPAAKPAAANGSTGDSGSKPKSAAPAASSGASSSSSAS
ncbi:FmdB family zinc ribbon protein [Micromonospora sp. NPDC049679]|uniref:FmdB family zinc ribbon protein n=1 Tax=Micromonospora sp. NPDC049679 TaxID=3155920 RepID=UPI0033D28F4A